MMAKIEIIAFLLSSLLFTHSSSQYIVPEACLQFRAGSCTRCARQTHLFDGVCYRNMLGCTLYKDGQRCLQCQDKNFQLNNQTCSFTGQQKQAQQLKSSLYKYSGQTESNPGDQYGQSGFEPSSYQTVYKWPSFISLDNYIRRGQYSHYISRMSNPVYSVHVYKNKEMYSYKVLYQGSGGGLFLCIADIGWNLKVQLRSLAPISASNVVYNCYDYDLNGRCLACRSGNHLESGKCYSNYGGCIRYNQNICIQCLDYYFLVENRCTSDCLSVSDSRSILFYGENRNVSSLQLFYKISVNIFYTASKTTTYTTTFVKEPQNVKQLSDNFSRGAVVETFKKQIQNKNQNKSVEDVDKIDGFISASIKNPSITSLLGQQVIKQSVKVIPLEGHQDLKTIQNLQMEQSLKDIDYLDKQITTQKKIKNCLKYSYNKCTKCQQYYFLNQSELCEEVSHLCIEVNEEGKCTHCFSGYLLQKGNCQIIHDN